jgi:hypothetical protein
MSAGESWTNEKKEIAANVVATEKKQTGGNNTTKTHSLEKR